MDTDIEVCPECGQVKVMNSNFCVSCGFKYLQKTTNKSEANRSFINTIREHASSAREKTSEFVSPEKASQAVQNMVDVVTYVAQDLKQGMSSEMVKAITVSARISFVAFSVGVNVALDKLPLREDSSKMAMKENT